jgi:SAM-dependent methyltransferase
MENSKPPWLYRCYWKLEQIIVPGLRSSQYAYYEALRRFTASHPAWLDLGCGHHVFAGWMDEEQREVVGEARVVVGMDYDVPSLHKHQAVHRLLAGDVSHLPFSDGAFDLVSANMVVEHLEDVGSGLLEIRRVLKPGGIFVFHTPNYLNFWVFFGSLAPDFIKKLAARLLEGRAAADVFPTRYRMNTPGAVRRHAADGGFEVRELQLVSTSAGTGALGPLSVFELFYIRLLGNPLFKGLRTNLVGVLQKPAASRENLASTVKCLDPGVHLPGGEIGVTSCS